MIYAYKIADTHAYYHLLSFTYYLITSIFEKFRESEIHFSKPSSYYSFISELRYVKSHA